ncbi:MAG: hypothetical protein KGQ75_05960 [Sphingomonadales bacterium]|nr:hypothetical protein [Sphingomonadales bacterium]
MGRRPKTSSVELALPAQVVAAAHFDTIFSDVVAACFETDQRAGAGQDPHIVERALASLVPLLRWKSWALQLSCAVALIAAAMLGAAIHGDLKLSNAGFTAVLVAMMLPPLVQLAWHHWQYSSSALPVRQTADPVAEAIFAELLAAGGPRLFVRSFLTGRFETIDRRIASGRLRYLLLSPDRIARAHVTAYPSFVPLSHELYLTRTDAERLRQAVQPKRKGGPGRKPTYNYTAATLSVMRDLDDKQLPKDLAAALREIEDRLLAWFEEHADASCNVPRRDQVKRHAAEIYEALMARG